MKKYATPEEAAEARKAYQREYQKIYKAKRREAAKQRYQVDPRYRAKRQAESRDYYYEHREKRLEYAKAANARARETYVRIAQEIVRTFELLPEERREEYALWVLMLAEDDHRVAEACRRSEVDYDWLGV